MKRESDPEEQGPGHPDSASLEAEADNSTEENSTSRGSLVVGVGASAGGLDAIRRLFQSMPNDTGMSFVVVQHLDPTHESMMVELLSKHTEMRVLQAEDGTELEANCIYVIPPNRSLTVSQRVLRVFQPEERRGMRLPIDQFLSSLARDQQDRAVGIILSGTASDGTQGIKEVKAYGGLVLVQDPGEAQHDGMPRNAIASGAVDHILPVQSMPEILLRYATHGVSEKHVEGESSESDFLGILGLLRARIGHDFRSYKKSMLVRRIQRRMMLQGLADLAAYRNYLRESVEEAKALFDDMLIGVTSFFRDPEVWEYLREQVILPLVTGHRSDDPIRVWVPACSIGKEAYTVAMLFLEAAEQRNERMNLQVFATDVDREALDVARAGVYSTDIAAEVSSERLKRFFVANGTHYTVAKALREVMTFAVQDLISDPPFSRMDLISCRNLLIYLEPEVQRRVVPVFHFALREGGHLFLGHSEATAGHADLFQTVSKKWRVYRRIGTGRPYLLPAAFRDAPPLPAEAAPMAGTRRKPGLTQVVERALLREFAPASVLVDRRFRVLYYFGPTEDYLAQPTGETTNDLLAQARQGLRSRLRRALNQVLEDPETTSFEGWVHRGNHLYATAVTVIPLQAIDEAEGLLLVAFQKGHQGTVGVRSETPVSEDAATAQVEEELKRVRQELSSTIEELETANEELQASNEEVMSSNEELQSSNEELESSKEELQSLNEELSTVNTELREKVEEVEQANNDLQNLLTSTNIATIFLDTELRIRRLTPAAMKLFSLMASDVGRPLSLFFSHLSEPDVLLQDANNVLEQLVPVTREIQDDKGQWYIRRVLPYRTHANAIEGVVVTFTDVTALKQAQAEASASLSRLQAIFETMDEGVVTADLDGNVLDMNAAALQMHGLQGVNQARKPIGALASMFEKFDAETGELIPVAQWPLFRVVRGEEFSGLEVRVRCKESGAEWIGTYTGARVPSEAGPMLAMVTIRDITEKKRSEARLREAHQRINGILESITDAFVSIDRGWRFSYANGSACLLFKKGCHQLVGHDVWDTFTAALGGPLEDTLRRAMGGEATQILEVYAEPLGAWLDCRCYPSQEGLSVFFSNITAKKQSEQALRESEMRERERAAELAAIMEAVPAAVWIAQDPECRRITGNRASYDLLRMSPDSNVSLSAPENERPMSFRVFKDGVELAPENLPVQRAARGEAVWRFEEDVIFQDGETISLYGNATPLLDEQGNPRGAVAAFLDISDRKRMEDDLRQSEERYRAVGDSFEFGVWMCDAQGNCTFVSQSFLDLVGATMEQAREFGWKKFMPPEEGESMISWG